MENQSAIGESGPRGGRPHPFEFSIDQLAALHHDPAAFLAAGGPERLLEGLRTDRERGLDEHETLIEAPDHGGLERKPSLAGEPFVDRKHAYLDNQLPRKPQPTFPQLLWGAYNDPILFLLTAAAAVSLAVGLYQSFGAARDPGTPSVEWVEGVAILVAVVIIVLAGAVNDWEKERQFRKLESKQLEREVTVVRSGRLRLLAVSQVLVGDVVRIEAGDVVPADGILLSGHNITCDESTATGESELVHKRTGDDVYRELLASSRPELSGPDPFLTSGTRILEGIGSYLVTATGRNSTYGRVFASTPDVPTPTPLQARLGTLAKHIARLGSVFAALLFVALLIKFLATLPGDTMTPSQKGQVFIDIFIITLTVLVIAVPEGLPIVLTLSLAFATTKMLQDNNLVRRLQACETMGNATSICSDKTGTLTEGKMVVREVMVGAHTSSAPEDLAPDIKLILRQSIALNSTAFPERDGSSFVGSNTECALLTFAQARLGMRAVDVERSSGTTTQIIPFSSVRQCMATVIKRDGSPPGYRVFVKGAAEALLDKCTAIVHDRAMEDQDRQAIGEVIDRFARRSLRMLSFAYKDISCDDPVATTNYSLEGLMQDLTFVAVVGMEDPLRPAIADTVAAAQKAGVTVRMVTGDNIQTATAIAEQCGILNPQAGEVAMEGREFRQLGESEMDAMIPQLRVVARSSPTDKQTLVMRLRGMGEVVAVTGDGNNDAPAMGAADVSFSMGGRSGTEVAREASSIVLLSDDFTSIVKAIMWGRAVNDSVKKFLQFQITVTATSVALTLISAIANSTEHSVLTAVQLMWVNLFQDTLAALALATDPPRPEILDRTAEPRDAPLITTTMWKTIAVQSVWQLAVTLVFYFAGSRILPGLSAPQRQTLVFNIYVWLQIFNMYNNRQYDNTLNVFAGIFRNWLFMSVSAIMIGGQILIIFVGGTAFSVLPLNGPQWAISIVLGALSIPIGALTRLMPDWPLQRVIDWSRGFGKRLRHRAPPTGADSSNVEP